MSSKLEINKILEPLDKPSGVLILAYIHVTSRSKDGARLCGMVFVFSSHYFCDVGEHSLIVSDFNPKMSGMKSSRSLVVLVRIHGDKFG